MKRILMALAAMTLILLAAPASAAPKDPYQRWLDETAVVVSNNGVTTSYTERQVGDPSYQAMMKQRLSGGVSTQTMWANCPNGVGCGWQGWVGSGATMIISIGGYGTNTCRDIEGETFNDEMSSGSADYGNGWDLKLYDWTGCTGATWVAILTSHSVNFTGPIAYFNNLASSFKITQAG
jgi:hypothetical protein